MEENNFRSDLRANPAVRAFDAVWKFLSSLRLAIVVILLLATVSIIGTVLAQGDSQQDNIPLFESWITRAFEIAGTVDGDDPASVAAARDRIHLAAERLFLFSRRAGFTNLYHTWYFYGLLMLFSLNLLVCSLNRWPVTWKMIGRNKVSMGAGRLRGMPARYGATFDSPMAEVKERVLDVLRRSRYRPRLEEEGGTASIFSQKGVISRLGVYAVHLSIIVILLGGIIGVTNGFKGYMQITEGTEENRFFDRRSKSTKMLPFTVRCENFQVDYYPGTLRPKDFYSDLVVFEKGEEKLRRRIEVNSPLVWDDIWFYQSSYGDTGRGMKTTLQITDPEGGEAMEKQFSGGQGTFSAFGKTVRLLQVLPDFDLDKNQMPYTKSGKTNNPAAYLEAVDGNGNLLRTWVFQRYPELQMNPDFPLEVTLADYSGIQYTGLQVVYDPGVWVIWLGCTIMMLGLYVAFFISHRRLWVRIEKGEAGVSLLIGGTANKGREGLAEEVRRLGERIGGQSDQDSNRGGGASRSQHLGKVAAL